MPLDAFHPAVASWFADRFGAPTVPQVRGWEAIRSGRDTLIAAPTGSGKTLAAFLHAIDELLREAQNGPLPDETRVVYVSPLKALSNDIHKNLAEPRREIRRVLESMCLPDAKITAAVRTGDTPQGERQAMVRTPPHILVTTPESLYLLLTAERGRALLGSARTVIVDEIHAVVQDRRGAHLALSLERLDHVAGRRLQRVGLSATQRPIEDVARFLVGSSRGAAGETPDCTIVDEGHQRATDLAVEVLPTPLEAVMSGEAWSEVYDRLAELIEAHDTTLVFVNTRRLAERVTHQLAERLGEEHVAAHHGSLSRERRLDAEERLKSGTLRALVATASLELGIDIGTVELVCQLGSPHRIAALLQRVGRSGHTVHGTPKGRLFPLTRDDLVECAALVRAARCGALDRIVIQEKPLDVLAQQIVAETASEEWKEDALFELLRGAWPYRKLARAEFGEVIEMVARGFTTRRGRRGALVHRDAIHGVLRGRRGARLLAITSGGAIPDNADYRVVLEPEGTFVGTLNEDFAIESSAGDIFQLGNTSWLILRIESGTVRVADAHGQPPTIPFWFGEAPGRSPELSEEVSDVRAAVASSLPDRAAAAEWLTRETGLETAASSQIAHYLDESRQILGTVPTIQTLVLERFFDEAGGMQLVLHAPFGSRVNRAWGLALRKRFCRGFNFELQAAATEEGILLSLGPQHSFPLDDVFHYLHPDSVREILVQALLDAPVFQTRWRWNGTRALAIPRARAGRQVPAQIQRMMAEDLLAAVFPDAAACLENIAGDRAIPDHPLVRQTIDDCLVEAMDIDRLAAILRGIQSGAIRCAARDTTEPSPLAHELLTARPYAFLDDAPLEERRAQAVYTRRAFEPSRAQELGALDAAAIERVRGEAWPDPASPDELHDALLGAGFLTESEVDAGRPDTPWQPLLEPLMGVDRVGRVVVTGSEAIWCAAERIGEVLAVVGPRAIEPAGLLDRIADRLPPEPDRATALRELLRGRLEISGPRTSSTLAAPVGAAPEETEAALAALEAEGVVLRGRFTPGESGGEWCERGLLARIHRYTLNRLRAEIEPVNAQDLMRFLFAWQRVEPGQRMRGAEGLAAIVDLLDGFELPAAAWEADVLPARVESYEPQWLDALCLSGRLAWSRLSPPATGNGSATRPGPLRSSPVALYLREHSAAWRATSPARGAHARSAYAAQTLAALEGRGASFFHDLVRETDLLPAQVEAALAELVALGLATCDGFSGLRALLTPASRRKPRPGRRARATPYDVQRAGRWEALPLSDTPLDGARHRLPDATIETQARVLLRRYGVVFRRVLERESAATSWRDLLSVYRRLEARGEIRGGRFVAGFAGEQFALPEAVGELRAIRRRDPDGTLLAVTAADPLNLTGIVTPGDRIPALATNRVVFRDGVPVAAVEAGALRLLAADDPPDLREVERAIVRGPRPPLLRSYLGSGRAKALARRA
jgi:ATP-dependent Lhr-like helicase